MISTRHTQSLTDFRQKASETLDRINRTGQAEILTVNGEAKAVLMAPAAYDELARASHLAADVATMRKALRQIAQGKGRDLDRVFNDVRSQLLAARGAQQKNGKSPRRARG